jgi:argininosuccinate lyase
MPQKKNPDVFELTRGKGGTLIGDLTGLLATLKALPSAYDKDLQEDKLPVFRAYDNLVRALPVLAGAVRSLSVRPERMAAAIDSGMMATDAADWLVMQGVPFREAHEGVGRWVRAAQEQARDLREFGPQELSAFHPALTIEVRQALDPLHSVSRRQAIGGTSPEAVTHQLAAARLAMESLS